MPRVLLTREQKLERKRESNKKWAMANRQKVINSQKKYAAANKSKEATRKAAARKLDPVKFAERARRYREASPEKAKADSAKRYELKKEEFLIQILLWRKNNPERLAASIAKTRSKPEHVDARRAYHRQRYAENIQARTATLLRNRMWKALKRKAKPESVLIAVQGTLLEVTQHIEKKFHPGMSWQNHGQWHIDHIRPLASFDLTDLDQYRQACHFKNLQPLWKKVNQSKGCRYEAAKTDAC